MSALTALNEMPTQVANLVRAADDAGGAVLVFGSDDRVVGANSEQRRIIPLFEYSQEDTYSSMFWLMLEKGFTGNSSARDNPENWLNTAISTRRSNKVLHFSNVYPWGEAACSHILLDCGTSVQIRMNLEASGLTDYYGPRGIGLGVLWALRAQQEMRNLRGALDSLGLAVGLIGAGGRLAHRNSSFSEMLAEADGLLESEAGHIVAADPYDDMVLQQAIEYVASGAIPRAYAPVRRAAGQPHLLVISGGASPGTAVVTVSRFGEDAPEIANTLREAFGITPAEAEVMAALGCGATIPELAASRGTTVGTIYNQTTRIKSALKRSGFAALSPTGLPGLVSRIAAIARPSRSRKH